MSSVTSPPCACVRFGCKNRRPSRPTKKKKRKPSTAARFCWPCLRRTAAHFGGNGDDGVNQAARKIRKRRSKVGVLPRSYRRALGPRMKDGHFQVSPSYLLIQDLGNSPVQRIRSNELSKKDFIGIFHPISSAVITAHKESWRVIKKNPLKDHNFGAPPEKSCYQGDGNNKLRISLKKRIGILTSSAVANWRR